MLYEGDRAESAHGEDQLERDLVADRVRTRPRAVEVLQRVDVDDRRVIGHLGKHAQDEAASHQNRRQPVPP